MSTYGSHQSEAFNAWNQRQIRSTLHQTLWNHRRMWTSSLLTTTPFATCRSPWCLPYISAQEMCPSSNQDYWTARNLYVARSILCWISSQNLGSERTRPKVVKMYKIQWNHHTEEEATWETEDYLHQHYPGFLKSTPGIFISVFVHYPISGQDSF